MFKKSPEQHIIIEADKVASMKESLDALSWDRVAEIGKLLQSNLDVDKRYELGRELLSISQANISLLGKLGIAETSFTGKMMPSGVEVLQSNQAIVTFPSGEPVFPTNKAQRSLEGYTLIAENDAQEEIDSGKPMADPFVGKHAVNPDETMLDARKSAIDSLYDSEPPSPPPVDAPASSLASGSDLSVPVDTSGIAIGGEADQAAANQVHETHEKLAGIDSLIPACDEEVVRLDTIPSALDPTDGLSDSVRSILFPVEGQTAVIPDLSTTESDFFSAPEPCPDSLIPRGTGAAAVTGASGLFTGAEFNEGMPVDTLAIGSASTQHQPVPTGSSQSVFESVLEFAPEMDQDAAEESQSVSAPTGSTLPISEAVLGLAEAEIISGQDLNLTLSALSNTSLMAELGIEPEIREALIKEIEAGIRSNAPTDKPQVHEKPPAMDPTSVSDDFPGIVGHASVDEPSSVSPSDDSEQEVDVVLFDGKDDGIIADLERRAKHSKKLAGFAEMKDADKEQLGVKTKKVSKKELAGFRQIYTSRDGALNLYVDSSGHVVAVDSARLI